MTKEVEIKSKFDALYIDPIALRKVQYWTDAADGEVSGLGIVEIEDGKMIIKDAYILDQECSAADTELDPEAISKLMTNIIKEGKDPGKLKFWWHSHVNMSCFWSGTDDECAETLSTEFAFSLVVNKARDSRVRLDLYNPFRITVDHVKLIEMAEDDEDLKKKCQEDVKDKVKRKTWINSGRSHDRCGNRNWGRGKGYYNAEYGGYYGDEYEYGHINRPKNWGKRVKVSEEDLYDIKRLQEIVHILGYSEEALNDYTKETMQLMMREVYEEKAGCKDGPGSFWPANKLCQECDISEICKTLTDRFGDDIYEGENIIPVNDIEITDADREEGGEIEVTVDADKEGGEHSG